jgi:hypothetical protein
MLLLPFSSIKDCAADYTPTGSYPQSDSSSNSSSGFAVGLQRPSSCQRLERGKRLADGVEALIGAIYLTAATEAAEGAVAPGAGVMPQSSNSSSSSSSSSSMPVSEQGLAAAAAFCEAVGILPEGTLCVHNLASELSSCVMQHESVHGQVVRMLRRVFQLGKAVVVVQFIRIDSIDRGDIRSHLRTPHCTLSQLQVLLQQPPSRP